MNEVKDGEDYNGDGDTEDEEVIEEDLNEDGRFARSTFAAGNIFVDFFDPMDKDGKHRLTLSDLAAATSFRDVVAAGASLSAFADLHLEAKTTIGGLPRLSTDMTVDWMFGYSTPKGRSAA